MNDIIIRTLIDPIKHITSDKHLPDHYCDVAADGTPFNSTHLVYQGCQYLGTIIKEFAASSDGRMNLWEIRVVGSSKTQYSFDFDEGVQMLVQMHKRKTVEEKIVV